MELFGKWTGKSKTDATPAFLPQKNAPKILRVSDYITVRNIAFFPSGSSKHQILGNLIVSLDLPDPAAILKAILSREEAGSTLIAPGLALPHARIQDVPRIFAAIGICPAGVVDIKAESGPVRVMVLFVGPSTQLKEHLAFLAGVSALFQTEGLVDTLTALSTPDTVLNTIRAAEKAVEA